MPELEPSAELGGMTCFQPALFASRLNILAPVAHQTVLAAAVTLHLSGHQSPAVIQSAFTLPVGNSRPRVVMKTRLLLLFCVVTSWLGSAVATQAAGSPLDGHWRLDPARSSALSFWRTFELKIATDGDQIVLTRHLGYGNRGTEEIFRLDVTKPDNVVPVEWWADNRYMGLYMGGDGAKHVRASRLDEGRTLRLDSNFIVTTQQGEKSINILSDYKVSLSGDVLTLIELRSARMQPFVYVFKRVAP
jgi:hypothetical protein